MRATASASAPVARASSSGWPILIDVERAAAAVPGLRVGSPGIDGLRRAEMGTWSGTVRLLDVDEDEHAVTYELRGRRTKPAGTAYVLVGARLESRPDGCRVDVELSITAPISVADVTSYARSLTVALAQVLEAEALAQEPALAQPAPGAYRIWPALLGIAAIIWVVRRIRAGAR